MGDNPAGKKTIKAPERAHPDDKVRTTLQAAVDAAPLGGTINRLLDELIPTKAQKARETWEGEISERTNEHSERLDRHEKLITRKVTLAGVARQLAIALALVPSDGMRGRGLTIDDLCTMLPGVSPKEVEDAAFDLHSHKLVKIQRAVGKHWWLHFTQRFYEEIDRHVMNWSTEADARTLAQLLMQDETRGRTATLHEASGWEKRRFNPAFQLLLRFIPKGRVSREIQPDYPSSYLSLICEDRAALRKFVAETP
jgi:hypothetical protein